MASGQRASQARRRPRARRGSGRGSSAGSLRRAYGRTCHEREPRCAPSLLPSRGGGVGGAPPPLLAVADHNPLSPTLQPLPNIFSHPTLCRRHAATPTPALRAAATIADCCLTPPAF